MLNQRETNNNKPNGAQKDQKIVELVVFLSIHMKTLPKWILFAWLFFPIVKIEGRSGEIGWGVGGAGDPHVGDSLKRPLLSAF